MLPSQGRSVRRFVIALGCLLAAACQTGAPVTVFQNFTTSPRMAATPPSQIAVLPVEDGTPGGAASRHLTFLRQEINRQLVLRKYSPLNAPYVDSQLHAARDAAAGSASGSNLDPTYLRAVAGQIDSEAVLAVRLDRWDEGQLLVTRRIDFQMQAALIGRDGQQLWFGTLNGQIKAGGAGASPRDREYMARSCAEIAVHELALRLPMRL